MGKTKISWATHTWNFLFGCSLASTGCSHCYAMRMAHRMRNHSNPKIWERYQGLTRMTGHGPVWNGNIRVMEDLIQAPYSWKKPRMVFVNSMSDLFHRDVPEDIIIRAFDVMADNPKHVFQVLTKRPERVVSLKDKLNFAPNIWVGTSTENQETANQRVPFLMNIPAKVRFLSIEPLLGPIDIDHAMYGPIEDRVGMTCFGFVDGFGEEIFISWVIVGCESGAGRRPMDIEWVRDLRDQCVNADVPFFFKQMIDADGKKIENPELDGKVWMEWPTHHTDF